MHVTEQVEYILDHNPELEAIAFANDNMAKAGYRVCAARDLLVGHDIALTGFDDIDHAKTMEPPLTSVSHSSFQFSYQALQNALMLCQGKKPQSCRMSAIFHQRSSCGCQLHTGFTTLRHISMEQLHDFIHQQVDAMAEELFPLPFHTKKIVITIPKFYMHILKIYMKKSLSGRELTSPTSL
ncbi:MAG: substrate-binding domain-containing protein [Roseburia sp.]